MRPVPVHYLRPNEQERTPPVLACFDTETTWTDTPDAQIHTLRCWTASLTVRRGTRTAPRRYDEAEGDTADTLARTLDDWAACYPGIWAYAHNLAFDLTVSGLVQLLCDDGWKITEFAVDSPAPFVRMTRGQALLTFADSFSWLPVSLEKVAGILGTAKFPLPDQGDDLAAWLARCRRDTGILTAAMSELMDWWDRAGLGTWSLTSTASGWNAMRHLAIPRHTADHACPKKNCLMCRHLRRTRHFVIDTDPAGIAADRAAIYGGRRGSWRTGPLPRGRYAELDFKAAYPTIAARLPLPQKRMYSFTSLPAGHAFVTSGRHGIIARVRIKTDVPRWPARCGRRVWYPVGEFWTDLAGPDIAEAARLGALAEIGPGYVHELGYTLAPWARWVLGETGHDQVSPPPIAGPVLKHWGRAIIGKWAQHGFTTIQLGAAPTHGWWATEGWNHTRSARMTIVDFGGTRWQATADGEPDNTYPAILAWVESAVRVRLGRLIDALPAGAAVACDTDGLIMREMGRDGFNPCRAGLDPLTVRIKGKYRQVEVIGPQHLILDGHRRFAGVPASATEGDDGALHALLWPKLPWQMHHGQPGTYARPWQAYTITGTYAPGWVLASGEVAPVEMRPGPDGTNRILPWPLTTWALLGSELANIQNRDLERYRDRS